MIYSLWDISRTTKAIRSCDTSTERAEFSAYLGVHGIPIKFDLKKNLI